MEGRHQRRALATGGHVAAPKVGHRAHAGALGDHAGIAQLPGKGQVAPRTMAHGLAMRADRGDLCGWDVGQLEQRGSGIGEGPAHGHVQPAQFVQRVSSAAHAQRHQPLTQHRVPGIGMASQQPASRFEGHQGRIDAIGAGAGNEPEEQPCIVVCHRPIVGGRAR